MKLIYVCQIVDTLSEGIIHTFMAANNEHAVRRFQDFLKSMEGKVHNDDFDLLVIGYVEVPDSYSEAEEFSVRKPDNCFNGVEVMEDES